VFVLHEGLPPERLAGFVLVWIALTVLTIDALRDARAATTERIVSNRLTT
jgi:chloramphenicol-sensitive protein RarD